MRRLSSLAVVLVLAAACDRSEREWRAAAAANTLAAYEQFLSKHPDSERSSEAEARIEALSRRAAIDSAMRTGTREALERVLARYPKDPAAAQVRAKLDALHYDAAAAVDSIRGWETFLQKHAQSPFAAKARQRIEAILAERHPAFRDVKTVRIEVAEDYGEASGVKLPYGRIASEIFPHAGVKIVDGEADAVLVIRSSGTPRGANYTTLQFGVSSGGRFLYTAVDFSGAATLRAGDARLTVPFRHDVDVPLSTTGGSASPDDAPFERAFSASVPFAMRLLAGRAFGANPLLAELTATDRVPDASVGRALGALESPPIERLIAILRNDTRSSARSAAVAALGEAKVATPLIQALRDAKDETMQCAIATALAKFPNHDALRAVIALLGSGRPGVRTCSAKALMNEFENAPVWEVPNAQARKFLEGNRDAQLVEALLRGLDGGDAGGYEVDTAIVSMLETIGDPAVPRLAEALKHPSSKRRDGAARALSMIEANHN